MLKKSSRRQVRLFGAVLAAVCALLVLAGTAVAQSGPFQLRGQGVAHNLNVNATAGAHFVISSSPDGRTTISGGFDNRTLFGTYTASGRRLRSRSGTCFQFNGTFVVGGADGSGFPPNTTAPITLTVTITGSRVQAIYHIGPLPSLPLPQYGTIEGTVTR